MAYIKPDFIEDLLSKVDIKDIISDYTEIKKKGAHFFGLSPFTAENSPSFCVNVAKQRYNCYSSGKSGNVVTFLIEKEHLTYPEAIETIAKKYGIPVQYENEEVAKAHKEAAIKRESLRPILTEALERYQKEFISLPVDHPAKVEVFQHRQYDKEIVLDWQIGYAPGNDFIFKKVEADGRLKLAQEIGLVGPKCDKLWDRVLYPIHDVNGLLIGFAGRDLSGKKTSAKWLNPSESIVYKKDKTWFGLNRAKNNIIHTGEAWLVEGYNDVIAWQTNGILNTIAPCGTAITENQIKLLKRFCTRINFCMDADKAGIKSMLKYIPVFLKEGFRVNVIKLPKCDPDDFVRIQNEAIDINKELIKNIFKTREEEKTPEEIAVELEADPALVSNIIGLSAQDRERWPLDTVIKSEAETADGFKVLMDANLGGSELDKSIGAQHLCEVIATIQDDSFREIYLGWLQKESKLTKAILTKWVTAATTQNKKEAPKDASASKYNIPKDVTVPFDEIKDDIFKYSLFMANNKIYMMFGEDGNYSFRPVSNFSIEIIQHMQDEKFPMKLIRIKNIHNLEKIFDIPSEYLNTPMAFDNAVTAHGNFLWDAGRNEFQKLRAYLFDRMGTGRKIDVLGWQSEGFWAWNNTITLTDGNSFPIDENGIFIFEKISYYIPSANKIYANNPFKYEPQKKFKNSISQITFKNYVAKAMQVHRDHTITCVLFALASAFQDIVTKELGNFPIFYLYGPASTGKDQLAQIAQSFFGEPQTPINLEGGASTLKAKVLELAQFQNAISHFSEYKRGDANVDGILKGFWDRNGYKRGNIVSFIGVESIPILSSVILTGNEYPDNEALITRCLWNEMTKSEFSDEEVKTYEELQDMTKGGISSFANDVLKYRGEFQKNFQNKYRMFKETFAERMPDVKSRMISNVSILGATYEIFKEKVDFPFTFTQMLEHFMSCTTQQMHKLNSASIINKWWDCFLSSLRGHKDDRLTLGVDFKTEQGSLFFNMTNVYNKVQRQWWIQYHEAIPGKSTMIDQLKKESTFIATHKAVWISTGNNTSAFEINFKKLSIYDELYNAMQFQMSEGGFFENSNPPVTPKEQNISKNENQEFFNYDEK